MRTSTLRRYTCSNSSSGEPGGRPLVRARNVTGRAGIVLTSVFDSVLMSLVAILASGCDIGNPSPRAVVARLTPRAGRPSPRSQSIGTGGARIDAPDGGDCVDSARARRCGGGQPADW